MDISASAGTTLCMAPDAAALSHKMLCTGRLAYQSFSSTRVLILQLFFFNIPYTGFEKGSWRTHTIWWWLSESMQQVYLPLGEALAALQALTSWPQERASSCTKAPLPSAKESA